MKPHVPALLAALALSLTAAAGARGENAADTAFVDRQRALALDERCALFGGEVRIALEAGVTLARNSLLRAGWNETVLTRAARQARQAAEAIDCDDEQATAIAAHVREGFEGWRQLKDMTFPGDQRTWTAKRLNGAEGWQLTQNVSGIDGPHVVFGIAWQADDDGSRPALAVPQTARARAARILVRDGSLADHRLDSEMVRLAAQDEGAPLAAAAAPDVFTRTIWASERTEADADSPLAGDLEGPATVLWFPAELTEALAALDPREAVAIDIDLAPRGSSDTSRRLYAEVGDFAPAAMFARVRAHASSAASSSSAPANPAARTR